MKIRERPTPNYQLPGEPRTEIGEGLVKALDDYRYHFLRLKERAAARMALNALDEYITASPERDRVRQEFLDALAWYRKQINQWLQSESPSEPIPSTAANPSVP